MKIKEPKLVCSFPIIAYYGMQKVLESSYSWICAEDPRFSCGLHL